MDRDDAIQWLDAYVEAWRTYDEQAIGDLFTDDAEYRTSVWAEPLRGRAAIVSSWLGDRDEPGTWQARYEPWAVEGDRVVAVGRTHYDEGPEHGTHRTYHNVFLCRFDADRRCRDFTEVYQRQQ